MSNREMVFQLADSIPDIKLGSVVAFMQGILAGMEPMDTPNETTIRAIEEAHAGIGLSRSFSSVAELMEDLDADD